MKNQNIVFRRRKKANLRGFEVGVIFMYQKKEAVPVIWERSIKN